jgi:hypothetical protein
MFYLSTRAFRASAVVIALGIISPAHAKTDSGITEELKSTHTNSPETRHSKVSFRPRPVVATHPFKKNEFVMNAFLFVRKSNQSWTELSQKIYGRKDRANLLRQWNPASNLQIGSTLYYNSPLRPDDQNNILPISKDFGIDLETYTVKKGESLSLIAKRLYGHFKSWREIAAVNPEIINPDIIEVGQTIKIQPVKIETKTILDNLINQVAQNTETQNDSKIKSPASDGTQKTELVQKVPDPLSSPETAAIAVSTSNKSISLSASNILGFLGILLLFLAVGVFTLRRLQKIKSGRSGFNPRSPGRT